MFLLRKFVNKWIITCRHHWVGLISFLHLSLFWRFNLEENKFSPSAFLRADITVPFKCQRLHAWLWNVTKLPYTKTRSLRDINSMTISSSVTMISIFNVFILNFQILLKLSLKIQQFNTFFGFAPKYYVCAWLIRIWCNGVRAMGSMAVWLSYFCFLWPSVSYFWINNDKKKWKG